MKWKKLFKSTIPFEVLTQTLPTKGNLVYEYNPFRNYRLSSNKYWYKENYYTKEELKENFGITISDDDKSWIGVPQTETDPILYEKGLLVDFITDEFKFSLEHPVHIIPLYSYDGSVNLIINDGLNIPRLINSRFSATGKNTYEIIDRKGNNDTNIYDLGELFDIDTSLYKRVVKIPKIDFKGVSFGGNLKVGNYHFYFKLADADGNETDFVGESGLVSVFIGYDNPNSIHSGLKNENSFKLVKFLLSNIDTAYDNVYVYYSRYTAEGGYNFVTEYKKIGKKFIVNNLGFANIVITGYENTEDIAATDINLSYNVVDSACTSATCLNMLFLANVHKPEIPYKELADLSLRFLPYLKQEKYLLQIDLDYTVSSTSYGYYNPNFIYNKTGYWGNEIYRFGIVYIMPNGELTPVFNIRGANNVGEYNKDYPLYSDIDIKKDGERKYIEYNDETFLLISVDNPAPLENVKGVVRFSPTLDADTIYSVDIRASKELVDELKLYVKGYFFVRQTRIPTILAQGITIGIDKESRTPCIPTIGGILDDLYDLDHTHVDHAKEDVNYISEGFISRYRFHLKKKHGWATVLSSILSAISTITSFIPGLGSVASLIAGAANFVISSIAEGKFLTIAFLTTVITAATMGSGAALGKLSAKLAEKGTQFATTASKLVLKAARVVNSVGNALEKAYKYTSIAMGVANAAVSVTKGSKFITQELAEKRYDGRNTEIPPGYEKVEDDISRIITDSFSDRIILKDVSKVSVLGIICPDYEVNLPYFNQIFTGNNHVIRYTMNLSINSTNSNKYSSNYFSNNTDRHFYHPTYYDSDFIRSVTAKIVGVSDNVKCIGLENEIFRSRAGEAEEAWKYLFVGKEYEDSTEKKENSDIVRGSFGAYLATSNVDLDSATIVDIMIPEFSESSMQNYFEVRMNDTTAFNAISDRIDINNLSEYWLSKDTPKLLYFDDEEYKYELYRGDCYLCQYTHRLNRNFNDPSAPYNDEIVDKNTWKDNYDPDNSEKYEQINLGDVNAVPLGMWVTFKLRSSNNLNIRTLDGSNVDESAMVGHPRGFYPYHPMSTEGTYKHPDSEVYNKGFTKSLSERWNLELPDVPYIKNWFGTRIMYSDIHINDAYKNGYRVFQGTHYRDYTREYGEIVKLVPFESSLLCVFEHGVALIPVNERAVAGEGAGGNVYINTSNVLPENPKIISDMFGSLWPESVLKVPGKTGDSAQYVYGVDTVAKKIWRTDGSRFECISDFRVQEFLNNNITLGERELTPKIGIRNVKTHYNAFKRDVMFTFYDNTYGFEEKVWSLCWNELLLKFITFYSWVPSYMENINNIPFSFDRNTSKWIAKLGVSHSDNSFADGITLSNVVVNNTGNATNNYKVNIKYIKKDGSEDTYIHSLSEMPNSFIGALSLSNRVLPDDNLNFSIHYSLERDNYGNYKMFEIRLIETITIPAKHNPKFDYSIPIYGLFFRDGYNVSNLFSELYYRNKEGNSYADYETNKISYLSKKENGSEYGIHGVLDLPIFKSKIGKRPTLPREEMLNPDKLVTLLNIKASILILYTNLKVTVNDDLYNMAAGFESGTSLVDAGYYESVVAITPKWNLLFLTTDFWKHGLAGLIDIADDIYPTYWYGKQHPFEFECIVVNDPSTHKIFTNLELIANKAKPESFHFEIIGESYDFAKDKVNMYFRQEAVKSLWLYNGADICYNRDFLKILPKQQAKSADLPHKYYTRQDTINDIEDYYLSVTLPKDTKYDYKHLSGAEIVYYPNRLEYRVWQHVPAISLDDLSLDTSRSLITANCLYLEDRWKVTINPILICYKNEYLRKIKGSLFLPENSTWTDPNRPPLTVLNSPIPDLAYESILNKNGEVEIPEILTNLGYSDLDIDTSNWLNDVGIYGTNFGEALNRKEIDLKDKFIKVRIRYSGEELAVIDFLNTVYRISYS